MFSDVAEELERQAKTKVKIKLYYVLPGSTESEASHSLNFASTSISHAPSSSLQWIYGHPYSQQEIPLPCPATKGSPNLGHYIPWFDDDPKARFIDEIAYTTDADGIKSPVRKRPRKDSTLEDEPTEGADRKDSRHGNDAVGELAKVTPDEFWERMSFRQECIAGTLTGFFTMGLSSTSPKNSSRSELSPLAPQPGQVSSQLTKRVMTSLLTGHEFSNTELSIRATGALEDTIKGLCDGLKTTIDPNPRPSSSMSISSSSLSRSNRPSTPEPEPQMLAPPQTPPPRMKNGKRVLPDVSPNPFPEPVASLETYNLHIYGLVHVDNPPLPPKAQIAVDNSTPKVTVLTVRKKKKKRT